MAKENKIKLEVVLMSTKLRDLLESIGIKHLTSTVYNYIDIDDTPDYILYTPIEKVDYFKKKDVNLWDKKHKNKIKVGKFLNSLFFDMNSDCETKPIGATGPTRYGYNYVGYQNNQNGNPMQPDIYGYVPYHLINPYVQPPNQHFKVLAGQVLGKKPKKNKIEELVTAYRTSYNISNGNFKDYFEIVRGFKIWWYYTKKKSVVTSCMRGAPLIQLLIYVMNPFTCRMLIMKNDEGKTKGRALIWRTNKGFYMDNIYVADHKDRMMYEIYAKYHGMITYDRFDNTRNKMKVFVNCIYYKILLVVRILF